MKPSTCPDLLIDQDQSVRRLTLNRPQSKNGLTMELNAALIEALDDAGGDASVRAVLLCGAGGSFCSGLDLKAAVELVQSFHNGQGSTSNEERMDKYFHGLIRAVRRVDKPVVAFLDGMAAGFGCDLALACDLRYGTSRAALAELFVRRGLMPDGGGTYTLPRLVGVGKALELMFLGETVSAEEAQRLGLLNRIVQAEAELWTLMHRLAAGPPLVLRAIKQAVYRGLEGSMDSALAFELTTQNKLLRSNDCGEGMTAFFMKRPPEFTGT